LKFYVNETYDAKTETRPRRWSVETELRHWSGGIETRLRCWQKPLETETFNTETTLQPCH